MAITPLPSLDRTSGTFRADTDDFFGTKLPTFSVEVETARVDIEDSVVIAANEATLAAVKATEAANAAVSASSAALTAGAVRWVSGLYYAAGDVRFSPLDFTTYRRKTNGSGTTDPSLDSTNWSPSISGYVTLTGAETVTNKRFSASLYLDKTVTNAAATGTVTLDLALATVFDLTLTGNTTLAISNAPTLSNETLNVLISVTQGATAYSLTWFSGITWLTTGGIAPAAPAANKITEYVITSKAPGVYKGRKGAST